MNEDIFYNLMVVVASANAELEAIQADKINDQDTKVLLARITSKLGLMVQLYGPRADEVPGKPSGLLRRAVDGILK